MIRRELKKIMAIAVFLTMTVSFYVGTITEGNQNLESDSNLSRYPMFKTPDVKIVSIPFSQPSQLGTIIDHDFSIIDVKDSEITAYASNSELEWLYESDYNIRIISDEEAENTGLKVTREELRLFHNYATMTAELQDIASLYPDIATLESLGRSVLGRTIWGLKVTDNPDIEENEIEIRFCGAHHGNEYMSVELPLLLAWHLTENYGIDPYITDLVNTREIWIIPMVNPDGREAGTRRNANNVDLNRDYGYMWDGSGSSPSPFSQPETQVIRNHALINNFVISYSYHTTAAYVNYVWNYKGQPTPDHDYIDFISDEYAALSGYTSILGYDWYQVRGDTNDFSYGCRGDLDTTIETANSNIPSTWNLNRDAMLLMIDYADMGLTGIATNAQTGDPLEATVWVEEAFWPCYTDSAIGDYHKPLFPGTYTVHYQANGYQEQVHTIEVVDSDEPTVFNVALSPEDEFYAHQVTWVNYYDPYGYPNNFNNNPTEAIWALGPPDDLCASLGKGGTIVLDMKDEIIDIEDASDFIIYEGDDSPDGYHVYGSTKWQGPYTHIGDGSGTTEFDLADGSLTKARFIKIVDDNDGSAYEQNPGCDIDAVENVASPLPPNNPPNIPEIPNGLASVYAGYEWEYSTITTDPEGHQIFYKWNWGDEITNWIGAYNSGEQVSEIHSWAATGSYEIQVQSKDDPDGDGDPSDGLESDWSDPLLVTVKKPGDVDGNGVVNIFDLLAMLAAWGPNPDHPADINGDDVVDVIDLLIILANWG